MWKGSGLMMHLSKHEKKLAEDSNVIYHYTSADIFLEYIFPDRTLKLSPLEGTNDPNEFEPWVISGINSSDYHLYKEVLDKTNEFKKRCAFVSFSTNGKAGEPGFSNSQMWAHYGQRHRGVCLAMNCKQLINEIENAVPKEFNVVNDAVQYESPTNKQAFDLSAAESMGIAEYVQKYIQEHKKELFFWKDKVWESENEFRIIIEGCKSFSVDISKAILCVIFGSNYPYKFTTNFERIGIELAPPYVGQWVLGSLTTNPANSNMQDMKTLMKYHNIKPIL